MFNAVPSISMTLFSTALRYASLSLGNAGSLFVGGGGGKLPSVLFFVLESFTNAISSSSCVIASCMPLHRVPLCFASTVNRVYFFSTRVTFVMKICNAARERAMEASSVVGVSSGGGGEVGGGAVGAGGRKELKCNKRCSTVRSVEFNVSGLMGERFFLVFLGLFLFGWLLWLLWLLCVLHEQATLPIGREHVLHRSFFCSGGVPRMDAVVPLLLLLLAIVVIVAMVAMVAGAVVLVSANPFCGAAAALALAVLLLFIWSRYVLVRCKQTSALF